MQQNARVIILTLDAARAAGLELARPLDALEAAAAASADSNSSASASSSAGGLNGRATPTSSIERGAALSSVDDDSESDDEDEDGERRGENGNEKASTSSSTSSLFDRPAGFAAVALPPPPPSLTGYRPITPLERTRGVAATLLLSFLGARLNSAFSLNAFVETVATEYRNGRAASALLAPLTDEELASVGADAGLKVVAPSKAAGGENESRNGSGSGNGNGQDFSSFSFSSSSPDPPPPPTTATAGSGAAAAGRALLSQWVSIAYMTMAQMGVPHALARSPGAQGWAFAGGSPESASSSSSSSSSTSSISSSSAALSPSEAAAEALALDRMVRATLRQLAEEKGAPSEEPSETLEAFRREAQAKAASNSSNSDSSAAAASFMRISDPNLASTSSALEVWGMALGLSRATAEHVASKAEEWGLFDDDDGGNGSGKSPSSSSPGSSSSSSSSEMAAAGEQQQS